MASDKGIRAGAAYVELFLSDSKLVRGLDKAGKKLKAFGESITGWGTKMMAVGTAITAPLVGSAKAFSEMGDHIAKMAKRTGFSVESLSELAYAAGLSGADIDVLEKGVRRMQRTLVDATGGTQTAVDALALLGLTVNDFVGLSPEEQFKLIADRLAGIESPTVRAAAAMEMFGRSGTELLPMMEDGAAGIEALQRQARDLGLTMGGEDAKAAEDLNDAFDTVWKVIKHTSFVIGAALQPALKGVAEWVVRTVVSVNDWIKRNREMVVTAMKVGVAIVVAGGALVGLGYAVTTVGVALRGLSTILGLVGSTIGVMGSILAWLVSPIGLVVVAVAGLAAYLIYATGAGGQALAWLGERFTDLSRFATKAFGGIADALMAGDIALAAKILWLTLKIAWQRGVLEIDRIWQSLKSGASKVVGDLWYAVQAFWEDGISSLTVGMLKLYYGILSIWERMSTGVRNIWDGAVTWVSKRIIDLQGLVDSSLDTDAVKKALDEDTAKRQAGRNAEKDASLKQIGDDRAAALAMAKTEHDTVMAKIGQDAADSEAKIDAEAKGKIDAAQAELDAARKEWEASIAEAGKKRDLADAQAPERIKPPPGPADQFEGLASALRDQKRTIGVAGTFNAMEARGLGAGGATDRIAKASEETARNTKKIADKVRDGSTYD